MKKAFWNRIGYKGTLETICKPVCKDFNLGSFISSKLVPVGYEDFNLILKTSKGKYFVKIFAKSRPAKDCKRYLHLIESAIRADVSVPRLFESNQGHMYSLRIDKVVLRLVVMEYVNGKDLYALKKLPSMNEIRYLARQAAIINSIKSKPHFIYDTWAITNFPKEYRKKWRYLSKNDLSLIKPLVKDFKKINIAKLPHAFVHGDIIKTNIIRDKNNKLWIVDFSVSNYYPRIQELAVLACNFLFDEKNKAKSKNNLNLALDEYEKILPLTEREKSALFTYIKLAHAMHVLCANYEKIVNNNKSEENTYFLNQGRYGLKQMIE